MRLPRGRGTLGYCLNVHPTQTIAEVRAALLGPAREVKRRLAPDRPFAIGLRLSAEAAAAPGVESELAAIFNGEGFAAFTMNGFPYGRFHGAAVKEAVYEPDWTQPERRAYTARLAQIMAALIDDGGFASISTVPGGFAPRLAGQEAAVAAGILAAVADLIALERATGRRIALALEPEPWCLLETTADAVAFFGGHLFTAAAAARLAALTGLSPEDAAAALPRHLGLCLDVCHLAVGFEAPEAALAALAAAGIPIHKLQLSAALAVPRMTAAARERLAAFADPVYLHQTNIRRNQNSRDQNSRLGRHLDLPDALGAPPGDDAEDEAWRVHFHIPVFAAPAPPLGTTRDVLERVLEIHRDRPLTAHLEVETYTWSALPAGVCGDDPLALADGLERELQWVLARLG